MTNKTKLPKYIAVVSHHFTRISNRLASSHDNLWSFIGLINTTERFAIAEGVCKGFKDDETFSIHIAKKIRKQDGTEMYKSILRVFHDGEVNDTSKEWFAEWEVEYNDIEFVDFE